MIGVTVEPAASGVSIAGRLVLKPESLSPAPALPAVSVTPSTTNRTASDRFMDVLPLLPCYRRGRLFHTGDGRLAGGLRRLCRRGLACVVPDELLRCVVGL